MTRPILLLDVDGVLNAMGRPPRDGWLFEPSFRSTWEAGGYELTLSREMGAAILALGCEIRWLTTWSKWEDFANAEVGAALGWGPKLVCECPRRDKIMNRKWKRAAAKLVLQEPGPPVVWVDDDLFVEGFIYPPDEDLDPHGRLLAIAPNPAEGLTRADVETIRSFIAERENSA